MKTKGRTKSISTSKIATADDLLGKWTVPIMSVAAAFFITTTCVMYMILDTLKIEGAILAPEHTVSKVQQYQRDWMHRNHQFLPRFPPKVLTVPVPLKDPHALLIDYESKYPPNDLQRIKQYVHETLRHPQPYQTQSNMSYDIYQCPPEPPPGYPMEWPIMDVIQNWNPGNSTEPNALFQGLCVFDYDHDVVTATVYRDAEVPFLITNVPDIMRAAERWHRDPTYLSTLVGEEAIKTEHSINKHFMYWKARKHQFPPGWSPPTDLTSLTYEEWLRKAQTLTSDEVDHDRWYFRLNGLYQGAHHYLYNELPLFRPVENSFFMVERSEERGINCRFGMKGVIAETHFDSSRNFIALMGGQRRYILSHPKYCTNMELYPPTHPSGRHTAVDWTNVDVKQFPKFAEGRGNEVVLQAGDALYLPTYWFHTIVSLNINYQCNARSGTTLDYQQDIDQCGFTV